MNFKGFVRPRRPSCDANCDVVLMRYAQSLHPSQLAAPKMPTPITLIPGRRAPVESLRVQIGGQFRSRPDVGAARGLDQESAKMRKLA